MNKKILGIDWGTSNRRAYLVDDSGACLAQHEDGQGMLAARGNFGASLAALIETMGIGSEVPVLMSGMVGSASGWQEVPYADCALPLEQLPAHLAALDEPHGGAWAGRCRIVPGYCYRAGDAIDVMRGEETQLLGAVALGVRDGWLVLPGTHSKWVPLRDGRIDAIATFMTGELYAMLAAGGTLAALMADGGAGSAGAGANASSNASSNASTNASTNASANASAIANDAGGEAAAFAAGLRQASLREPLSNSLFRVRARVVAGAMPARQAAGFVSGLLIGAEFAAALGAQRITVIGTPALAARYAAAAAHFGVTCVVLDPHRVYCAALARLLPGFSAHGGSPSERGAGNPPLQSHS